MGFKRKSWSPGRRAAQFQEQEGRCHGWPEGSCGTEISLEDAIAEHELPVALGNEDAPDFLLCRACADRKTKDDVARIAKAKRQGGETGQQKRRREGKTKRIANRPWRGWRLFSGKAKRNPRLDRP